MKQMKRGILIAISALFATSLLAQPGEPPLREKKEKVDAMRAAYITNELDLSTEEAQTFWPVYNEMDKKIEKIRMASMEHRKQMKEDGIKPEDLSDDELSKMMEDQFKNESAILAIKQDYHKKFIKVLGTKKTFKLYMAEREFMRDLMRKGKKRPPQNKERMKPE